jgi:hypothetical protein
VELQPGVNIWSQHIKGCWQTTSISRLSHIVYEVKKKYVSKYRPIWVLSNKYRGKQLPHKLVKYGFPEMAKIRIRGWNVEVSILQSLVSLELKALSHWGNSMSAHRFYFILYALIKFHLYKIMLCHNNNNK